jgi:hypothetical protein
MWKREAIIVFVLVAGTVGSALGTAQSARKPMEIRTGLAQYPKGRQVNIDLVVTNTTNNALQYTFSSGMQFDVWISSGQTEVWRLSRGRGYIQAFTFLSLAPGQSKTFSATWDQTDEAGKEVPAGSYVVRGQLTPTGERPAAVSAKIAILAKPLSPIKLSDIKSRTTDFLNKTVLVSGIYRGWKPPESSAGCESGPPVTRSDWVLSDGKACIYVTGPSSLDPVKDRGKHVRVLAQVKKTPKGQVYLRAEEVTVE